MRRTILWVAAVAALIAIPAVIGLVALRGDDSSSSARRAGALVVPGNSATAYQLQLTQALAGNTEIKEAIEVESFSWNPENPTTIGSTTGGAGSGKIRFNEMQVGKKVDKASPVLFKQMAKGAHYKTAILTCRKAGDKEPYMTITMETAFISKIDYGAGSPEVPNEEITFIFGKVTINNGERNADGTVGAPVSAGWDQVQNVSVP